MVVIFIVEVERFSSESNCFNVTKMVNPIIFVIKLICFFMFIVFGISLCLFCVDYTIW